VTTAVYHHLGSAGRVFQPISSHLEAIESAGGKPALLPFRVQQFVQPASGRIDRAAAIAASRIRPLSPVEAAEEDGPDGLEALLRRRG